MPALSTTNAMYVKRVRDLLRTGPDYRTAALKLGSGTSEITLQAQNPGLAGNNITVTVTVPSGTSALAVSLSGTDITIALNVNGGVPQAASNTGALICAALEANANILALIRAFPTGGGAGSLSAAVAKTNLTGGAQGSNVANIDTLPLHFLRAQDLSSALELLQSACSQSSTMTASANGTTTTLVRATGTFVPGSMVGNTVTFAANTTTAALRGVSAVVVGNTDTTLTFGTVLPAATASGDTFTYTATSITAAIAKLRAGFQWNATAKVDQANRIGDAPAGSIYGDWNMVQDTVLRLIQQYGMTTASGLLTVSAQPSNGDTVTIGTKTYTFQTVLTNVDGNVLIGASATTARDNLVSAIMLGAGSGTTYAAATTIHPTVRAVASAGNMSVVAKNAGTAGNSIATTKVSSNLSWGAATLTGGTMPGITEPTVATLTVGTGSTTKNVVIDTTNIGKMRVDMFVGRKVTIGSDVRGVIGNTETVLYLDGALSVAPSASTSVTVQIPMGASAVSKSTAHFNPRRVHPGGQDSGMNRVLADALATAESTVVAFTLPT